MKAISILSLLFTLFYLSFILFDPVIHQEKLIDLSAINPWLAKTVNLKEGNEMYFMVLATVIYLFLAYFIIKNIHKFSMFNSKLCLLLFLPSAIILLRTNSYQVVPSSNLLVLVGIATSLSLIIFLQYKWPLEFKWWYIAAGIFIILSLAPPRVHDYSFFIGPSLKLLQGEALGTFYIQYSNLGLVLFAGMMLAKLQLHQMEIVMGLLFIVWVYFYFQLASQVSRDKFLVFLFMVALLVLRFFAIMYDPLYIPQVGPFRLDLWVPLLLVVFKFGFFSYITGSVVALTYLADSSFGFVYAGIYGLAIFFLNRRKFPLLLLPTAVVALIQYLIFGSLINTAGSLHQDLALGFQPIIPTSFFWVVAFLLPLPLYFIRSKEHLFAYAVAASSLVYFYGRSHEHNLLNISGSWLLIIFLGVSGAIRQNLPKRTIYLIFSFGIIISALAFSEVASGKFERAFDRINRKVLWDVSSIDQQITNNPGYFTGFNKDKVFLLSSVDSYFNYRYGFKQVGYYSPFYAHVLREETAKFLTGLLSGGFKVVFWEQEIADQLPFFGPQFAAVNKGNMWELKINENLR